MALMKATKDGQVPMTEQEEADMRALWASGGSGSQAKPKTTQERLDELEVRIAALEASKTLPTS